VPRRARQNITPTRWAEHSLSHGCWRLAAQAELWPEQISGSLAHDACESRASVYQSPGQAFHDGEF
jgi:4'-phosphopantetheinyl transferase EntD